MLQGVTMLNFKCLVMCELFGFRLTSPFSGEFGCFTVLFPVNVLFLLAIYFVLQLLHYSFLFNKNKYSKEFQRVTVVLNTLKIVTIGLQVVTTVLQLLLQIELHLYLLIFKVLENSVTVKAHLPSVTGNFLNVHFNAKPSKLSLLANAALFILKCTK